MVGLIIFFCHRVTTPVAKIFFLMLQKPFNNAVPPSIYSQKYWARAVETSFILGRYNRSVWPKSLTSSQFFIGERILLVIRNKPAVLQIKLIIFCDTSAIVLLPPHFRFLLYPFYILDSLVWRSYRNSQWSIIRCLFLSSLPHYICLSHFKRANLLPYN